MHFVDDVDFEPALRRVVTNVLNDLADLIYAAVRRAIDLPNVQTGPGWALFTVASLIAGVGRRPFLTIERFGEDSGSRRLADAADSGEKIGMRNPVSADRILQRPSDVLRSRDVFKALRAPFTR